MFRKTNISYTLISAGTCAYQEVRNVSFSENFDMQIHQLGLHMSSVYLRID